MKRLTFLFLLAAITLCPASSALAHLHPQLQRFVQRDPAEYRDGASMFAYMHDRPTSARDPSGLISRQDCCAQAKSQRDQGSKAETLCCDGVVTICNYMVSPLLDLDPFWGNHNYVEDLGEKVAYEIVRDCAMKHEDVHAKVVSCDCTKAGKQPYIPPKGWTPASLECPAYQAELSCLFRWRYLCGEIADPSQQALCRSVVDKLRAAKYAEGMKYNCSPPLSYVGTQAQ